MSEARISILVMMGIYVFTGALLLATGIWMIRFRLTASRWFGIRLPEPLVDEQVWYAANIYSGKVFVWMGALYALFSLGTAFVPGIGYDVMGYNMACTLALMVVCGIGTWVVFRRIKRVMGG
jgi:hypothetical protein